VTSTVTIIGSGKGPTGEVAGCAQMQGQGLCAAIIGKIRLHPAIASHPQGLP
jgi:hypothetical protein